VDVQDDEVVVRRVEQLVDQERITDRDDIVSHGAQRPLQGPAQRRLVVDHEDAGLHEAALAGCAK
jgi:hypothetical protein